MAEQAPGIGLLGKEEAVPLGEVQRTRVSVPITAQPTPPVSVMRTKESPVVVVSSAPRPSSASSEPLVSPTQVLSPSARASTR